MSTWEAILGTIALALGNGGPSGLLYTYIVSYIGFVAVIASMAEMASMAPTSGGQYHWVSEFAPRSLQKLASYYIGWLGVLGYQIGVTISAFLAGTIIQGLIVLNHPETYEYQRWHGTLIAICITVLVALFNIFSMFQPVQYDTLLLMPCFSGQQPSSHRRCHSDSSLRWLDRYHGCLVGSWTSNTECWCLEHFYGCRMGQQ